jgi:hypothetical protein
MKTFKDLEFTPHPSITGKKAVLKFPNGYSVSVLFGDMFYSNGRDTYELAAIGRNGVLCYSTDLSDNVLCYQTEDQITKAMEFIQNLPKV